MRWGSMTVFGRSSKLLSANNIYGETINAERSPNSATFLHNYH